jgi:NAD(P)H-dependent FMN reductase
MDDVLAARGILLFTPENFGYMCGAMKDFFERIYYPCLERTQGLPYCLCVRAGQDNGSGAATSVKRIVTGLRWREAQPALLCAGPYQEHFCDIVAEFAATFAAGLEMGIF